MLFPSSRIFCPLGACDCLSCKTSSTLYRSTLVDHLGGYFCWNTDACTVGILTMEGEFLFIWFFYIFWSTADKRQQKIKYFGLYLVLKIEQNCPNHTLPFSVLQHLEWKWLHGRTCYEIFLFPHPQKEVF